MKKLLIGALCGLVSVPSFAADTWSLGGWSSEVAYIVDISTIENTGNTRETWMAMVRSKTNDGVDYYVSWGQFDCKTKKMRRTDTSARKFNKGVVFDIPTNEWYRPEPGSIAEGAFDVVCKKPTNIFGDFDTIEEAAKGIRKKMFDLDIWK